MAAYALHVFDALRHPTALPSPPDAQTVCTSLDAHFNQVLKADEALSIIPDASMLNALRKKHDKTPPLPSQLNTPLTAGASLGTAYGESFDSLVSLYVQEQVAACNWTEKSRLENVACYGLFRDYLEDGDTPLVNITRQHVQEYKRTLQLLPPNMNKARAYRARAYRGKRIMEILAMKSEGESRATMSVTTVNKYLNRLSTLFAACLHSLATRMERLVLKHAIRSANVG